MAYILFRYVGFWVLAKIANNPFKSQHTLLGPPLRRFICALIAQINQLRYGPLMGRYRPGLMARFKRNRS